jgi:hypothetical protein
VGEFVLVEGEAVVVAAYGFFVDVGVLCGGLGALVDHDEEFLLFFEAFDLGLDFLLLNFEGFDLLFFLGGDIVQSDGTA